MKFVLDTNAMTRLFRREPAFVQQLLAKHRADVYVPEVVFAEMALGVERIGKTKRAKTIQSFIDDMREEFQIAMWTPEVSDHFGRVKAKLETRGAKVEDFDIAIAAHALAVDATLATSNRKHFERIDELMIEDWA